MDISKGTRLFSTMNYFSSITGNRCYFISNLTYGLIIICWSTRSFVIVSSFFFIELRLESVFGACTSKT